VGQARLGESGQVAKRRAWRGRSVDSHSAERVVELGERCATTTILCEIIAARLLPWDVSKQGGEEPTIAIGHR